MQQVKIRDIRVILTAPNGVDLVVVKVETTAGLLLTAEVLCFRTLVCRSLPIGGCGRTGALSIFFFIISKSKYLVFSLEE